MKQELASSQKKGNKLSPVMEIVPRLFMKKTYIKFIDPRGINNNNFESKEDLEKYKARTVEAVGYLIKEDASSIYIAMQVNGKQFKKILFIPKTNIVERKATTTGVIEVEFNDVQYLDTIAGITLEKLESMGQPPKVHTIGFLVRDKEDTVLAMERNEDGKFRTQVVFPKIKERLKNE